MRARLTILAVAIAAAPAAAQTAATSLAPRVPPSGLRAKSPVVATGLSMLLPGAGQMYVGDRRRGREMTIIAIAGGAVGFLGLANGISDGDSKTAPVLLIGGLGTYVVTWVCSVVDAPFAARRHNARLR
ncbi:hypothetical protein J421_1543 [Gemmatirosa kalamazoonensis]|uniref:DUF5683 domain-containing protein n=1 Tax=Gemmatirosa kalamazoonensis TaxID=861299 RepID=W0RFG4_9BACT|nr:hypothetical protein [Gemmatirosa kalamazoonensis]AHG89080.1 hypothetical protein J421_1543 [Gemmatirosa kalamazoonensis]